MVFAPQFQIYDDYVTPQEVWEDVNQFIPDDRVVWEPFYCDGSSGEILKAMGKNVIHEPVDFFQNDFGEVIVTNPPFSQKKAVMQRLKELDKPFLIIAPIFMLRTDYVRECFGGNIQLIIPRKRIQFLKFKDGVLESPKRCNFESVYYCYKWNLPRDIIFL